MDLVLPQLGAFRSPEGRAASVPNDEVLSLTIKPTEFKPAAALKEPAEASSASEVLKHPRRFQALASAAPAAPALPLEEVTEALSEPEIPKHPRRFQALVSAGPAKLTNRFSRRERPSETTEAFPATPLPEESALPPESLKLPQAANAFLQLPPIILDAIARAGAARNLPPVITEGVPRKSKERHGVPPPLQQRPAARKLYDW